jgi:recombinational DNA repair protein (RecF pathway)
MPEYVTRAVVLGVGERNGRDRRVDLFTEELGRLEARIVGGRRMTSKLGPHFGLGNRVLVRLVHKHQFTVTGVVGDAVLSCREEDVVSFCTRFLGVLYLLRALQAPLVPDEDVWNALLASVDRHEVDYRSFLRMLGYDVQFALCGMCGRSDVRSFFAHDQMFLCMQCAAGFPERELVTL